MIDPLNPNTFPNWTYQNRVSCFPFANCRDIIKCSPNTLISPIIVVGLISEHYNLMNPVLYFLSQ